MGHGGCLNFTCFDKGECRLAFPPPSNSSLPHNFTPTFICDCRPNYDATSLCEINYFQIYKKFDSFYYIIGFLVSALLLYKFTGEIITALYYKKNRKKFNFLLKPLIILYILLKIIGFLVHCINSILERVTMDVIDILSRDFSITLAAIIYGFITVIWIDLVLKVTEFTRTKTFFKIAKTIIPITMSIFAPIVLASEFLAYFGKPMFYFLFYGIILLYFIPLFIWSFYQSTIIILMKTGIRSDEFVLLKKKNCYFMTINLLLFCYLVYFTLGMIYNPWQRAWASLFFSTGCRIFEYSILVFVIDMLPNHFRMFKPCWKVMKETITRTSSGSNSTPVK